MEPTNGTSCARPGTNLRRPWPSTSASGRCSLTMRQRASESEARLTCEKKAFSQVSNDKAYSFTNCEILHLESRQFCRTYSPKREMRHTCRTRSRCRGLVSLADQRKGG